MDFFPGAGPLSGRTLVQMSIDAGNAQVVQKVGALLRVLGASGSAGAVTSAIARDARVARATAHRLLTSLSAEGLVERNPQGRWHLGPELYLLGGVAAGRYDIAQHAKEILIDLAADTGESAFLSAARGEQTVCVLAEEGSFPLRSHVLHEGIRFPIGVASAGLVVLAHLPEPEAERYIAQSTLMTAWGRAHSKRALRARVLETRTTGYGVNPGLVVEGSWGIGAAVFDRYNRPSWALSLTGVETRLRSPRQQRLGLLLLRKAHLLTQRLQSWPA
jgi:DNA-binding IclR family transcriptional regulator